MSENQKFFALLIDGDNTQAALIPSIVDAVKKYGNPIIKKIYGDLSLEQLKNWKSVASKYNIEIEHHYNASNGKNATDIALVIDAMDILQQRGDKLTGFCIVSSDSDFTHLARRIRNEGFIVLGIGKNSSQTFKDAYDHFITTESLQRQNSPAVVKKTKQVVEKVSDNDFLRLFIKAYKQAVKNGTQDEQGRVTLRQIWEAMKKLDAEFSSEYQQIVKFVNKVKTLAQVYPDNLELEEQPDSKPSVHYVHIKPAKSKNVGSEIDKFREAYKHAVDMLKLKDKDGWVKLSAIGDSLQKLYPHYERLVYGGIKHGQLKKVIEEMMVDYPNVIELNTNSQTLEMRIKK